MITEIGIGDVLAVNTGTVWSPFIELGEELLGQAHQVDHVIIAHHRDKRSTWWGIEGRPGGVGWRALDYYLNNRHSEHDNSNAWQTRTDEQRAMIARSAESLLGVGYDWAGGIIADTFGALKARELAGLADEWWGWRAGERPGHVVCSSLASWVYGTLELPHPEVPGETTTPGNWWLYNHQGKD